MSARPLLVGELNPYGSDPRYALFPLPVNASGARLAQILGLSTRDYLRRFERVNLCAGKWSIRAARLRADSLRKHRGPVILLGRRVAAAFALEFRPFATVGRGLGFGPYCMLPHPSGRNRAWNDPAAAGMARGAVKFAVEHRG